MAAVTTSEVLQFGCWKTSSELSSMNQDQQVSALQLVLGDSVSSTTELVDDGSAVAFLQMNGQILSNILVKSLTDRREEMETLLSAAFAEVLKVPTTGLPFEVLLEYLSILKKMQAIFPAISSTSTFDIAKVCCRSFKYSKYLLYLDTFYVH